MIAVVDTFTPEVIQSLGSAGAATLLSVFFIWTFTRFQKDSINKLVEDNKEQRCTHYEQLRDERKTLVDEMKEERKELLREMKEERKDLLDEMKADRKAFSDAIEKVDRRLEIQELLITRLENRVDAK